MDIPAGGLMGHNDPSFSLSSPVPTRSPDWLKLFHPLKRVLEDLPPLLKTRVVTDISEDGRSSRTFNFANLNDVLDLVTKRLFSQGFLVTFAPVYADGGWCFEARLLHETGAWISNRLPISDPRNIKAPTEESANYTLYSRYALCQLLGISAEEVTAVSRIRDTPLRDVTPPGMKEPKPAKPKARPAPEPAATADDAGQPERSSFSDPTMRSVALSGLDAELKAISNVGDVDAAHDAWREAEPLLKALGRIELEMTIDTFRKRFGEPPAIDGLSYPARIAAPVAA